MGWEGERKLWLISGGVSRSAWVSLFGSRGKINIMSPNCLCVSLSSSLFSLYPLSLSASRPTILRQLLLCSQINCSPVAFGKCEINKHFASKVHGVYWFHIWNVTALYALTIQNVGDHKSVVPNPSYGPIRLYVALSVTSMWSYWLQISDLQVGKGCNISAGCGETPCLNHWPYLDCALSNIFPQILY